MLLILGPTCRLTNNLLLLYKHAFTFPIHHTTKNYPQRREKWVYKVCQKYSAIYKKSISSWKYFMMEKKVVKVTLNDLKKTKMSRKV